MAGWTLRGGVGAHVDTEIEVRRSRFITRLERVDTEEAARDAIQRVRKRYPDARHHCTAFVVGADQTNQVRRSNDDGEPSGTAGAPMLDTLTGAALVDCVAVVTRYFGGVLLGTGGLTRAYSDAVSSAIEQASTAPGFVRRVLRSRFALELPHADAGRVEAELRSRDIDVLGAQYGAAVTLSLAGDEDELASLVAAATGGGGILVPQGNEWVDEEGGD
ncbi:IMPACT family protein [Ruicaihuangia caeni]|uniref:YigZ family protein n=1 Tax=Ruicaihuangia caeni TaxID=3042517 RepID=A0AAW6T6Y5_9MICO|nr:YigZ family protein [Klugiella sp. YN-L-19]MDI2099591.1 YigZ family protein [Klugiella sp. YN-L-19]